MDTPICNDSNQIIFFKTNFDYFHPEIYIFRIGSMEMITFHNVKQGRLLDSGQCIIYEVEVDQEVRENIVANMLG